jgi:predicted cobalt transporter CbtA
MVGMPEVSSDLAPAQTVIQATVVPIAKYLTCAKQLQIHQMMVQMGTSTALIVVQLVVLLGLAPALPAMKALVVQTVQHAQMATVVTLHGASGIAKLPLSLLMMALMETFTA